MNAPQNHDLSTLRSTLDAHAADSSPHGVDPHQITHRVAAVKRRRSAGVVAAAVLGVASLASVPGLVLNEGGIGPAAHPAAPPATRIHAGLPFKLVDTLSTDGKSLEHVVDSSQAQLPGRPATEYKVISVASGAADAVVAIDREYPLGADAIPDEVDLPDEVREHLEDYSGPDSATEELWVARGATHAPIDTIRTLGSGTYRITSDKPGISVGVYEYDPDGDHAAAGAFKGHGVAIPGTSSGLPLDAHSIATPNGSGAELTYTPTDRNFLLPVCEDNTLEPTLTAQLTFTKASGEEFEYSDAICNYPLDRLELERLIPMGEPLTVTLSMVGNSSSEQAIYAASGLAVYERDDNRNLDTFPVALHGYMGHPAEWLQSSSTGPIIGFEGHTPFLTDTYRVTAPADATYVATMSAAEIRVDGELIHSPAPGADPSIVSKVFIVDAGQEIVVEPLTDKPFGLDLRAITH